MFLSVFSVSDQLVRPSSLKIKCATTNAVMLDLEVASSGTVLLGNKTN